MPRNIKYKLPRMRTESEFTVYPNSAGDKFIKLQSDNHCMLVDLKNGRTLVSRRFDQYPHFEACLPQNGGKAIDTPDEIIEQLQPYLENPTGARVTLL
jgi:hypothetical protein